MRHVLALRRRARPTSSGGASLVVVELSISARKTEQVCSLDALACELKPVLLEVEIALDRSANDRRELVGRERFELTRLAAPAGCAGVACLRRRGRQLEGFDCSAVSPYVIVGHSLGGMFALSYVRRYAAEVGGVVLLDSMHPRQPNAFAGMDPPLAIVRPWREPGSPSSSS